MQDDTLRRICRASRHAGIPALVRLTSPANNVRVVLTHFVEPADVQNYRRVMEDLLDGREPIDPADLVGAWRRDGDPIQGKRLAVTFDDGLLSSFDAAQDVLNPLGIRAIFFVPTAILSMTSDGEMRDFFAKNVYRAGSGSLAPERYRAMTAAHLRELQAQGHRVMPHSHTHINVGEIRDAGALAREIDDPRAILEDLLQAPAEAYAFPFGTEDDVSAGSYRRIRTSYSMCFTGLRGVNTRRTDPYQLFRDSIHPHHEPKFAEDLVAGALDPFYAWKMRRLRRRTLAG